MSLYLIRIPLKFGVLELVSSSPCLSAWNISTGGRMHPHSHPESKEWMDVGGFVDTHMATGGFA